MTDIPLKPQKDDIYSFGFDKNLNRAVDGVSTGVVYDAIGGATNAAQMLTGGNLTLKSLSIGGLVKQVAPGDDIQAAIDEVSREGGGTVQLLSGTYLLHSEFNIKRGVLLVGAGRDVTVLDFEGRAAGVLAKGNSSSILENFSITNLTVQNSNHTAGIDIDYADFWRMDNVRVTSCDQTGIRIDDSSRIELSNVRSDNNTGDGFRFLGNSLTAVGVNGQLNFCIADTNGGQGFNIQISNNNELHFVSCISENNTDDGFSQTSSTNTRLTFLGCKSSNNGGNGFDVNGNANMFIGCKTITNTLDGFNLGGKWNVVLGIDSGDTHTLSELQNTILHYSQSSWSNEKIANTFYNVSGGSLVLGDVVVLSAAIGPSGNYGESVTTTTTQGDDKVVGMFVETTADNSVGGVLTQGKTASLKVNGTTAIAIGDFLGTYTSAGIAMKAAAGDMAFAIALEAYSTADSNGVIDALIIKPRKI